MNSAHGRQWISRCVRIVGMIPKNILNICHTSCVTCHLSCVMFHVSCVVCHLSTCHVWRLGYYCSWIKYVVLVSLFTPLWLSEWGFKNKGFCIVWNVRILSLSRWTLTSICLFAWIQMTLSVDIKVYLYIMGIHLFTKDPLYYSI